MLETSYSSSHIHGNRLLKLVTQILRMDGAFMGVDLGFTLRL